MFRLRNQREERDHIVLDTTERAWEFVQGVEEVTEKASLVTIWWVVNWSWSDLLILSSIILITQFHNRPKRPC